MKKQKYNVTAYYQSLSGNPLVKRYIIYGFNSDHAFDLAAKRVKRLKNFGKLVGGDAQEII